MIGIIGGTGLYETDGLFSVREEIKFSTKYGQVLVLRGIVDKVELAFISRHGLEEKKLPPHRINYRANIAALAELGVKKIIATSAVGSLRKSLVPGTIVLPNDCISFAPAITFFDDEAVHTDMTQPFCESLRKLILAEGRKLRLRLRTGIYAQMPGPQFETPAEIKMLARLGADVVGMTAVSEAKLAREKGLCYQVLCPVTNYAAGIAQRVEHEHTLKQMRLMGPKIARLIIASVRRISA